MLYVYVYSTANLNVLVIIYPSTTAKKDKGSKAVNIGKPRFMHNDQFIAGTLNLEPTYIKCVFVYFLN